MADVSNTLRKQLSHSDEITISVTGRKSGRRISNPIWFVFEDNQLYLLPVKGSDTQWYRNVLRNPSIGIEASGNEAKINVTPVSEAKQVASVIDKFRTKYGAANVKKYYSKFDVAVIASVH